MPYKPPPDGVQEMLEQEIVEQNEDNFLNNNRWDEMANADR